MSEDPSALLENLRRHAGGPQVRDWQIFPQLIERVKSGAVRPTDLLDDAAAVVEHHTDRHLRRWALSFLPLLAEHDPALTETALRLPLAALLQEAAWLPPLSSPDGQMLWQAAALALTDLARRLPSLMHPYRARLLQAPETLGPYSSRLVLDALRDGLVASLRPKAVRSTPKLFATAAEGAVFVILDKDRYHTAHCRHLQRQVRVRVVPLTSREEAGAYGFTACGHCHRTGADGQVAAKPKANAETPMSLGEMPPAPELRLAKPLVVESPWTPPPPLPALDPCLVSPPSVYERLTLLGPNQQRLVGLWLEGGFPQVSDVYRAIYARHHASMLEGTHAGMAAAALEVAVTGLATDAWCASQMHLTALIAAYRVQDGVRFARVLALRPQTVFEYPFLLHLHGDLGAETTPELLFGLRKLSGTRSSASLSKNWDRFAELCRTQLAAFRERHGCDPLIYALRAGKGRHRLVSFGFGRDFQGSVRYFDVLHGMPLATVTGEMLEGAMQALRGAKRPKRAQREAEERAVLEALHAAGRHDARAVQALVDQLAATADAARSLADQGLRAFEAGDMVKAAAYLYRALQDEPALPGVYRRALERAASATGFALPMPAAP